MHTYHLFPYIMCDYLLFSPLCITAAWNILNVWSILCALSLQVALGYGFTAEKWTNVSTSLRISRSLMQDGRPISIDSNVTDGCWGVFSGVMKDGCSSRIILCDVVERIWLHSFVPRFPSPPVIAITLLLLLSDSELIANNILIRCYGGRRMRQRDKVMMEVDGISKNNIMTLGWL